MMLEIECSNPFQKKPGVYRSNATYFRVWWLWFAIALTSGGAYEQTQRVWESK